MCTVSQNVTRYVTAIVSGLAGKNANVQYVQYGGTDVKSELKLAFNFNCTFVYAQIFVSEIVPRNKGDCIFPPSGGRVLCTRHGCRYGPEVVPWVTDSGS